MCAEIWNLLVALFLKIELPYMSHFFPHFSEKVLKTACFERFSPKITKKSAIFVHFYF